MRSGLSQLELTRPADLEQALTLIEDGARPFAGGTDLMVLLQAGAEVPPRLVDISRLSELTGITTTAEGLDLGALTTYSQLRVHPDVRQWLPSLARAAELTGAVAIQNRGTLGGNIGNASPAADSLPCLLAYDATLELRSPRGVREVPYASFHRGYKDLDLAPDELIVRIRIPRPTQGAVHYFRKVGTRQAQAIAKVNLASLGVIEDGRLVQLRIGLGAVAPTPVRARHVERLLEGAPVDRLPVAEALAALGSDISPIDDLRSTAHYRATVARNLLGQALAGLSGVPPRRPS